MPLGAGGHAKAVAEALLGVGNEIAGYADPKVSDRLGAPRIDDFDLVSSSLGTAWQSVWGRDTRPTVVPTGVVRLVSQSWLPRASIDSPASAGKQDRSRCRRRTRCAGRYRPRESPDWCRMHDRCWCRDLAGMRGAEPYAGQG